MDFNNLLRPYREGGKRERPVKRTMETIVNYLLNKKQYPIEIVGGAIFMVFNWLDTGGKFQGNGSYGSPGKELISAIRIKCDGLLKDRQKAATYEVFMQVYAKSLRKYVVPSWKRNLITWWYGREVFK